MAIVVESSQSATGTTSAVVTKPTGLAVGDLIIGISAVEETSGAITMTAPSGFTQIQTNKVTNVAYDYVLFSHYKIADSGDVAASNFTWTPSGTANAIGVTMSRISGSNINITTLFSSGTTGNGTTSTTTTLTPTRANSLILLADFTIDNNSGVAHSTYALETSSPSFTEIIDTTVRGGSTYPSYAVAYGIRPETSATGTATITLASSGLQHAAQMLVIAPRLDETSVILDTTTVSEVVTSLRQRFITVLETVTSTDTLITEFGRIWRKATKPVTTWINRNKN